MVRKQLRFDAPLLALLLFCTLFILYRLFWGMEYSWHWQRVLPYLFAQDPEMHWWDAVLIQGLITTLKISCWAMLAALVIGLITALFRTHYRLFFRLLGSSYVLLIRNTPPLVLVFIFYYFISDQLFYLLPLEEYYRSCSPGSQQLLTLLFAPAELIQPFCSGILTLALFQGAYIGEIIRAGIEAIPRGQWEAAAALGLSRPAQLIHVIIPQALRAMLPTLCNEFINTVKWSSVVSIISIQELTFQAMQVMTSSQATLEVWIIITGLYLIICFSLSQVVEWIDTRFCLIRT